MMKLSKSVAAMIAVAGGAAMVVAGCGSSPSTNTSNSTTGSTTNAPTPGGTIQYALPAATNLNWFIPETTPADDSLYNTQLVDQIYKPLLWINNDYSINWNSSIASKITYNKAGTVYHVFLNPKWKWSNGNPVTSKDIMFTWNIIKAASASNAPTPWPFVGAGTGDIPNGVASVVPNGNYEVTFTLSKPANQQWFIYNGLIQLAPLPEALFNKYPDNMTQELKYLGSAAGNLMSDTVVDGPFKPVSATPSQSWVLEPNPAYSGHKSIVHKLVFDFEASTTAEFAALQSGAINIGYLDPSQLGSKSALTSQGDKIGTQYQFGIFWTEMNMWPASPYKNIFNQLYVRQALQMGMDNVGISQNVWKGYAVPLDGPIPPVPKTKFIDPSFTNPYPYNIAAGKQLLESHGWKMVDGVMTLGSQKLEFPLMYVTGNTSSTDTAELMQADWLKEGVKVSLHGEQFSSFIGITSNKTNTSWGLATGSGWIYNGPGFYPTGGQLFATGAPSGTGFSDQKEDTLIAATHQPYATAAQTTQVFNQYQDYTAKILPFLWGQNVGILDVTAPTVHNYNKYAEAAAGLPQLQYVWVSSK